MRSFYLIIYSLFLITTFCSCTAKSQIQTSNKFTGNQTLTYEECIEEYESFATHKYGHLLEFGKTDIGKPLNLFLLTKEGVNQHEDFSSDRPTVLINNAIHPGEPCGVDASVMYINELLNSDSIEELLDRVNVAVIPMYNIGGGLNRGCCSRANQNGPEFYGFRGNARNLDLNRDFIKCDSENAKAFTRIYQFLNPHVFLDTHTSNGADYQYVMTLITTQPDKATPNIRSFLKKKMVGDLYIRMEKSGYPMAPYVHTVGATPDDGIQDYLETPRYSTGYSTLYNCLGFVSETHMLKEYSERVQSTYELIRHLVDFSAESSLDIVENKRKADQFSQVLRTFEVEWELDTTRYDMINFKGYEAKYKPSEFSQNERLYYDKTEPFEKKIKYYNRFLASNRVKVPEYYVIPQAWKEVIERLELNQIEMTRLESDSTIEAEFYVFKNVSSPSSPYEGHYIHKKLEVSSVTESHLFRKGDYVIATDQVRNRYIVETLEPESSDSFFRWNFFDEILQQKEWFSTYVFEDVAAQMLEDDPELRRELQEKQKESEEFRNNQWAQLYWLYTKSPNYEPSHNKYPVGRVNVYK